MRQRARRWLLLGAVVMFGAVFIAFCYLVNADFEGSSFCPSDPTTWEIASSTRRNLAQCWSHADQIRFYNTNQGSRIVPYHIAKHLELAGTQERFFSPGHIENRWGFVLLEEIDWDERSDVNKGDIKDGWPMGFTIDKNKDKDKTGKESKPVEWIGMTCAACHTAQIEYKGTKLLVDGAPSMADINRFMEDLEDALVETYESGQKNGQRFQRFADNFPGTKAPELEAQLNEAIAERKGWRERNRPTGPAHGFARLDAFGVIFNEVIKMTNARPLGNSNPNAPVSYPFLWDTAHHDWTQWNGRSPAFPPGRNVGQALGVFATYDDKKPERTNQSSIQLGNQQDLQELIYKLRSPPWPGDIFSDDSDKNEKKKQFEAGRKLFEAKACDHCHASQEREKPLRHLAVTVNDITVVKTDPTMAMNAYHRHIMKNDKKDDRTEPTASHIRSLALPIIKSAGPFYSKQMLQLRARCMIRFAGSVVGKEWSECKIDAPHATSYKARPLDGIWATAPFLHNGSVANLYELLLPEKERMAGFCVGSREFEPEQVGFETLVNPDRSKRNYAKSKKDCENHGWFWLDTTLPGNRNTGHEYGVCSDKDPKCKVEIQLLVDYMKML